MLHREKIKCFVIKTREPNLTDGIAYMINIESRHIETITLYFIVTLDL